MLVLFTPIVGVAGAASVDAVENHRPCLVLRSGVYDVIAAVVADDVDVHGDGVAVVAAVVYSQRVCLLRLSRGDLQHMQFRQTSVCV